MQPAGQHSHAPAHAFSHLNPRLRDGVNLFSRRSVLKASLAGMAGLSLADLLRTARRPRPPARRSRDAKA